MTEELFEDIPVREKSRSYGRTITEGEFALLTDVTWTISELHSNAVYGKVHTSFGERALGGPIVSALVASLATNASPLTRRLSEEYGLRTVAAIGISARYLSPVLPGDTLWADTWLESIRPSKSRPGFGVATMRDDGINQNEALVTQVTRLLLVERG